jgi:hydrogenase maturation protein HypF
VRLLVRGAVQGVGFRPFVHRLAASLDLAGFVRNAPQGVVVEVEGPAGLVGEFLRRIAADVPAPARPERIESLSVRPTGASGFDIVESRSDGHRSAIIMPDIATCPDCLAELFDASNRRYRYPFTNCTHCGPRFSIIESIPYDRPNTSMRRFTMCAECQSEYDNPFDRRFHAQPNACPACGPHLALWDERGAVLAMHDAALRSAAAAIRAGRIVAVKGIGGFHLMVDARNEAAVRRLRLRKHREEKPLALMMLSFGAIAAACDISAAERQLLLSAAAPIVLLERRRRSDAEPVADSVAPGNPCLGIMLPYSPLHHLLMRALKFPVVATSGNRSDESICTGEGEALDRLRNIADAFLVHDRPIVRPVDDSVARTAAGSELILRRARGFAPLPIGFPDESPPILAVGAHLKNTVSLATSGNVFISQHIGDLETPEALNAFERATGALQDLYGVQPQIVACDMHPDYVSTRVARRMATAPIQVQHHHAHVAACMAEHQLDGEVLGICWDGTGYGPDGTIWGGEFLVAARDRFIRAAHLRLFSLPGGSRAVREPRRSAFGVLYEAFGTRVAEMEDLPPVRSFSPEERRTLIRMIRRQVNSPRTSSMGRLFDAVAALVGLRQQAVFEGQAAMELEFAAGAAIAESPYPFELQSHDSNAQIDWVPMIRAIVDDLRRDTPPAQIAARFHAALIDMLLAVVKQVGFQTVVLGGGCFQNKRLLEGAVSRLRAAGFDVYWPRRVPPNDGGISLGQAAVATALIRAREKLPCA